MNFSQVFDSAQEGVIIIDRDGRTHYANTAASTLFEVSVRRLSSGKPLAQFVTFTPNPIESVLLDAIREPSQLQEIQFQLPDGKEGTVQVIFQAEPAGFSRAEAPRWIMAMRDVTLEKVLDAKYKLQLDQKEVVINDLKTARAELERYSKNLESMVAERTAELAHTNSLLKSILDSLGQGILVFDRSGQCGKVYSAICKKLFGIEPAGMAIESALGLEPAQSVEFANWRDTVFEELLDFDDMAPLGLDRVPHRQDLEIALNYQPIRNSAGALDGVVVVATDRTKEVLARKQAEADRVLAERVIQISKYPETYRLFVSETHRVMEDILAWPQNGMEKEDIARWIHTIKGGAGSFFLKSVVDACHRYESELLRDSHSPALREMARVVETALKFELQAVAELLGESIGSAEASTFPVSVNLLKTWSSKLRAVKTVQEARSIGGEIESEFAERPIHIGISQFESSLKNLSHSLGKKLDRFTIEGGDTRVPIHIAKEFVSSLVHAFNNSVVHGLESPQDRVAAGKPEGGNICVRVARFSSEEQDWLRIEIEDDGRGIDPAKIRAKLAASGLEVDGTDHEITQAILRQDFSTAESVTELAGRGVGLAAIANEAKHLGGKTIVHSKLGHGMRLEIVIALTNSSEEGRLKAA